MKFGIENLESKNKIFDTLFYGIAIAIPLSVMIFVLYPILKVAVSSFFINGQLNWSYYADFFRYPKIVLIKNTIIITFMSTLFSLFMGLILALTVVRSHLRGRKLIHFGTILNMISPPFVNAIVFTMLLGRRGIITNSIFGLNAQFVGPPAIVVLQTISNASIAYLVISSVLKNIDSNLESAAIDLGASKIRVFLTVTFPLLLPGITAAGSIVFANVLSDFGTPILVGGGFRVLASEAYLQVLSNYKLEYAATISMMLLSLSVWIIWIEKLFLKNRQFVSEKFNYAYESNKQISYFSRPILLILHSIAIIYIIFIFVQFTTVAIGAFTNVWGYDYTFSLKHFSRAKVQMTKSLFNSLSFAFKVAFVGPFWGVATAYFYSKIKEKVLKDSINFLALIPMIIPGTVMGISYVMAFHQKPFYLTGTALIIIIICIVRELPISFNNGKAILKQMASNLEEASMDLGATSLFTFTRVIIPILSPAYKVGMYHSFIHVMITIGAIIFLITPRHVTLTFEIFRAVNSGNLGEGAAYALILIVFTLLGLLSLSFLWKIPSFLLKIKERLKFNDNGYRKY